LTAIALVREILGRIIVGGLTVVSPVVITIAVGGGGTIARGLAEGRGVAPTAVIVVPVLIPTTPGGSTWVAIVGARLQVVIKGKGFSKGVTNLA
jgi:hypothetical protein